MIPIIISPAMVKYLNRNGALSIPDKAPNLENDNRILSAKVWYLLLTILAIALTRNTSSYMIWQANNTQNIAHRQTSTDTET